MIMFIPLFQQYLGLTMTDYTIQNTHSHIHTLT